MRALAPSRLAPWSEEVASPITHRPGGGAGGGARAPPVGAVVGEVRLTDHEQAGDGRLQVVVDPQTAHRVVDRRVDPHGDLVGVLTRDLGVHVEEVAVLGLDGRPAQPLDGLGEVEVDAQAAGADAAALVADVLRLPRSAAAGGGGAGAGGGPAAGGGAL